MSLSRTVGYTVTAEDSVRTIGLSPEFHSRKPDIMASARLVAICEWPCMDQLRERMEPHQWTLGTRQHLHHMAPVLIGARLTITARCLGSKGRYSTWQVEVHDEHEQVCRAVLDFATVDRHDFEDRRLRPKTPTSSPWRLGGRASACRGRSRGPGGEHRGLPDGNSPQPGRRSPCGPGADPGPDRRGLRRRRPAVPSR